MTPSMKARSFVILTSLVLVASPPAFSAAAAEEEAPSIGATPLSPLDTPVLDTTGSWLKIFDFRGAWGDRLLTQLLIAGAAVFLGFLAGRVSALVLGRVAGRCKTRGWTVQEQVFSGLVSPASVALFALGLAVAAANVAIFDDFRSFCGKTVLLLFCIAVLWYASNLLFTIDLMLRRLTVGERSVIDRNLAPLIRKTLRVVLWIIGALFIASSVFEQNIGALLAGLGIAGLAVSLAAQDSLKNLFGSVTILLDRPFKVGDRIVFSGYDGVIEEIGFRSTKLRTLTGHLVTIPNSNIVNDPVENIGRRPSIRRTINVTITYDTPKEKIVEGVDILRNILEEEDLREPIHQTINGNEYPPRVYFNDYNAESLNIFVIYWFAPPAYWDYMEHAQKLNLRIFEEFEKAGIEFAFPTQTLYLAGDAKRRLAVEMLSRGLEEPGATRPA
ncbi:MAG: mechanosensitive ion channel family protein [Planctomycetota bacterium]|jgi:MscS family membrane protein